MKYRLRTIKSKLLLLGSALIIAFSFVTSVFTYSYIKDILVKQAVRDNITILDKLNQQLSNTLYDMQQLSVDLIPMNLFRIVYLKIMIKVTSIITATFSVSAPT